MSQDYLKLIQNLKKTKTLESIMHLLDWDQETVMPKNGLKIRSQQNAELSMVIHQKKTAKSFENLLKKCINLKTHHIKIKNLSSREEANLRLITEDFLKSKKLPSKFVKNLAELKSNSTPAWAKAKEENRFKDFAPYLEKMVEAMKKQADYLQYEDHPYDALLDLYEPKITVKTLNSLFKELKTGLLSITKEVFVKPSANDTILKQPLDEQDQLDYCRSLLKTLSLDQTIARLDTSAHPFCNTISNGDIRLTTHIKKTGFFNSISSTLHECGHAIYEAGLIEEDFGTPVGEACSLGIHESQSRLFETFIGQSRPFVHFLAKNLKGKLSNLNPELLYKAINKVEPSLIRIESDEVTYCLHIMLRYELEKKLIEGKLKVKELNEAWNEGMKNYLGIVPPSDTEGVLQDIHWSLGLFGYFPTYALGNLYAAQIYEKLSIQFKDLNLKIAEGEFESIIRWLNKHIHEKGREKAPQVLIQEATKKQLSCDAYLKYLKEKYL